MIMRFAEGITSKKGWTSISLVTLGFMVVLAQLLLFHPPALATPQ